MKLPKLCYIFILPCIAFGFSPPCRSSSSFIVPGTSSSYCNPRTKVVMMADISVATPSSDTAAEMGIREWPQQAKKGTWEETSAEGQTLVRYILDGNGSLEIKDGTDSTKRTTKLVPGTLVEVSGGASLSWSSDDGEQMIILTPGFEEGGTLLGVALGAIVLFGALIAGVGS